MWSIASSTIIAHFDFLHLGVFSNISEKSDIGLVPLFFFLTLLNPIYKNNPWAMYQ